MVLIYLGDASGAWHYFDEKYRIKIHPQISYFKIEEN